MGLNHSHPLIENSTPQSTSKTISIIIPGQKLSIQINPLEPISNLISSINQKFTFRYPIISLKTTDGRENLDYWLSLPEKDLTPLENAAELIAIFHSPVPIKISCRSFEIIKVLGKGAYSVVTLVRKKDTGILYAMKSIEKQKVLKEISVQQILAEKMILEKMDNGFICKMHWAFHSKNKLHIVMDYYPGGELFFHLRRVRRFSEEHAKFYFAEVLMSLLYLHERDIAYRDLKPENIVIDIDGHVRLTDFGLSKMDMRDGSMSFCGSPEYMSPEMLRNQSHTKMVDLYCVGVLLFELLTGHPPFYDKNKSQMYLKILNNELVVPDYISDLPRDLLEKLLNKNPQKRLGSKSGIAEVFRHDWLKDLDFNLLKEKKIRPPFVPDLHGSNIGVGYSSIKLELDYYSDTEPDSRDQFSQFEYNTVPDRESISKMYFGVKDSLSGLRTPRKSIFSLSLDMQNKRPTKSLIPPLAPSKSYFSSNLEEILKIRTNESTTQPKINDLNSPFKSTNFSFTSSNCNNTM